MPNASGVFFLVGLLAACTATTPTEKNGSAEDQGSCEAHDECSEDYYCVEGGCEYAPDYSAGTSGEDWDSPSGLGASGESDEIGAPLGEFCGVTAYQNGTSPGSVYNWDGRYGLEYQCTELAFRFLCEAHGLCDGYDPTTQGRYGDALQWFDNQRGNSVLAQLEPIPSGTTAPPQPGDILTFDGGTWGHVAVVKSVDLDASVVEVLEQNCYGCSHFHTLYKSGDSYTVVGAQGWMRAPGSLSCLPAGCEGQIIEASATDSGISVTGQLSCEAGIASWSITGAAEQKLHTESPDDETTVSFDVHFPIDETSSDSLALALWAIASDSDSADRLDDATVSLDDRDGDNWSSAGGDCNDSDNTVHPGAPELCDGVDNDCDDQTDEDTYAVEADPPLGQWTDDFAPITDCSGCEADDCYSLYRMRIDAINGHTADISITKANSGGGPSVDVTYWIGVSDAEPTCSDRDAYFSRTEGTWSSSASVLSLTGVPIWPTEEDYEDASAGTGKGLLAITGGSGYEDDRIWLSGDTLRFEKTRCD